MFSYLLGQESGVNDAVGLLDKLLSPSVLPFLIPIAAILVGGVIVVTTLLIRHRERIAMIEQGMNPDERPHRKG